MKLEVFNKSGRKGPLTGIDLGVRICGVDISKSLLSLEILATLGEPVEAVIRISPAEIHVDAEVLANLQAVTNG